MKNFCDYQQITCYKQNKKINHILILKDGRLSSSAEDNSGIYIYDKNFQTEMIIFMPRKHELTEVNYYIQSKNLNIIACFAFYIQIVKLETNNKYSYVQLLDNHLKTTLKVIELQNNKLISCSIDMSVIIWKINENNGKYEKINCLFEYWDKYGDLLNILTVKNEKELITSYYNYESLIFYDIQNNYKKITEIKNIKNNELKDSMLEYNNLLLIGGNGIYIFNLNNYQLLGNYFMNDLGVSLILKLSNENILLGTTSTDIVECSLKNNEIKIINRKKNVHSQYITSIIETKEKIIFTSSADGSIKLWKY